MTKGGNSSDEDDGKKSKKAKRTGPSLLQLEREKYKRGTAAATKGVDAKGKKVRREDEGLDEALAGFKSRILEAKSSVVPTGNDEVSKPEGIWGANPDELNDEDNVSDGCCVRSVQFRKVTAFSYRMKDGFRIVWYSVKMREYSSWLVF